MTEPWVRFEDEHLLVVEKPAGVNTHRADVDAQEGMYEWVQRQRPGLELSTLHRLDKATSGLLVFGASSVANRAMAARFERHEITKGYALLAANDRRRPASLQCDEPVNGSPASTSFTAEDGGPVFHRYEARPRTGRTHQVRAHAAALGMAVLGDDEHGGAEAARLFLHAAHLAFDHPVEGRVTLDCAPPASFGRVLAAGAAHLAASPAVAAQAALESRSVLFDPADTDAYLWVDRHHDGFPGTRVERLGHVVLVRHDAPALPPGLLDALVGAVDPDAVYEQSRAQGGPSTARLVAGRARPGFSVRELGLQYLIDFEASATSHGLFIDQRETRRRLRTADLAGRTVLNVFGHTGSLSVAAAVAGAETLTIDLSRRYLARAAENLRANDIDPGDHDFIYGDAAEWMARLAKKGRTFDLVLVDPPSSSTTRRRPTRRWVVDRDLHDLVAAAARLCAPGGTVFVSTNLGRMAFAPFRAQVTRGLAAAGRNGRIETQTLPIDFRSGPGDPPYLKAAWITLDD